MNNAKITRVLRGVIPVFTAVVVGYAGMVLLQNSHADQLTPLVVSGPSSAVSVNPLPTTVTTPDCCKISITAATHSSYATAQHVSLDMTITNLGSNSLLLSPGLQAVLTDTSGTAYNYTAQYLAPEISIGGPLASQATTTLVLDFNIPINAEAHSLVFEKDGSAQPLQIGLPAWTQ